MAPLAQDETRWRVGGYVALAAWFWWIILLWCVSSSALKYEHFVAMGMTDCIRIENVTAEKKQLYQLTIKRIGRLFHKKLHSAHEINGFTWNRMYGWAVRVEPRWSDSWRCAQCLGDFAGLTHTTLCTCRGEESSACSRRHRVHRQRARRIFSWSARWRLPMRTKRSILFTSHREQSLHKHWWTNAHSSWTVGHCRRLRSHWHPSKLKTANNFISRTVCVIIIYLSMLFVSFKRTALMANHYFLIFGSNDDRYVFYFCFFFVFVFFPSQIWSRLLRTVNNNNYISFWCLFVVRLGSNHKKTTRINSRILFV